MSTTRAVQRMILGALTDAAPRHSYQRAMYAAAALLFLSGMFHLGVWAVDGGPWEGAVSWRKPIVFGISFAISTVTFGWLQGLLPRHRGLGWLTTALIGGAGVVEVALITMQRWREVPSHFNTSSAFDEAVFSAMGGAVGTVAAGVLVLAGWCALRLRGQTTAAIAVGVGVLLVFAGSAIGTDMIARGTEAAEATGAAPASVTIGAAGSAKLAHAAALHAIQVLAVLVLLLGRSTLPEHIRTRVMLAAAAGYVGLTGLVIAQAYAGRAPLDLSWPMAAGLLACLALVGGAYGVTLAHPRQDVVSPPDRAPALAR